MSEKKRRKHSGRKRNTGELAMLNLRKFEKMIRMSGDDGFVVVPHVDPRYYPKIIPNHPRPTGKALFATEMEAERRAKMRAARERGADLITGGSGQ